MPSNVIQRNLLQARLDDSISIHRRGFEVGISIPGTEALEPSRL